MVPFGILRQKNIRQEIMCCFRIEYLWVRKNIRLATNSSLLTQTYFQLSLVKQAIGLRSQATQTGVLFKISVPP